MTSIDALELMISDQKDLELIYELEKKVLEKAHILINKITEISKPEYDGGYGVKLQIATSESLTAGLIMSTLVHLPIGGWAKYGCFGVYDTDAKRVFNGVMVNDVYTHTCAKEMAVGILKNSNATIGISVTGNAMPHPDNLEKLGEVFIGIAGYKYKNRSKNAKIIYETRSINQCLQNSNFLGNKIKEKCDDWAKHINLREGKFAPRTLTATVSRLIRNYTALSAMQFAVEFLETHKQTLIVPDFITNSKDKNEIEKNKMHKNIPPSKYPDRDKLDLECTNNSDYASKVCKSHSDESSYGTRWDKQEFYLDDATESPESAEQAARTMTKTAKLLMTYADAVRGNHGTGGMRRRKKRNTCRKKRRSKKKRYTRKR